jgi:hypothetical protein
MKGRESGDGEKPERIGHGLVPICRVMSRNLAGEVGPLRTKGSRPRCGSDAC